MTDKVIEKSKAGNNFTHRAVSEEVYKLLKQGYEDITISLWFNDGYCISTPDDTDPGDM